MQNIAYDTLDIVKLADASAGEQPGGDPCGDRDAHGDRQVGRQHS
jgi:hypothetical protein